MSYRETLRLHILPTLGRVKVQALRPDQVPTLNNLHRPSTQPLGHGEAVRDEVITRNPAAVVRPPAVTREEVKPWSPQEASEFLRASVGHRLYAVFAVGVALRPSTRRAAGAALVGRRPGQRARARPAERAAAS
jgi:hypothetical protein